MINEYQGTHKRVFKVDFGASAGALVVTAETSLHRLYSPLGDDAAGAPRRRRVPWRKWAEQIFLPSGFPNSTSPDLVAVAQWDVVQVLCSSIVSTLALRAVLIGVGVGTSSATAIGSTASWVMRDGVLMICSIIFSTHVSTGLDCRGKTWRLIGDFCHNLVHLLELCSAWFSPSVFLLLVGLASVLKALVMVAGAGTRQALLQHFARVGNLADVMTKARNRDHVAALLGIMLGTLVSYFTPPSSRATTLLVFAVFALGHLYANYRVVRATVLTTLNAPLMEWCAEQFYRALPEWERGGGRSRHGGNPPPRTRATGATMDAVVPPPGARTHKSETHAGPALDLSPELASRQERLFLLPPPPRRSSWAGGLWRAFQPLWDDYLGQLRVRVRFGVSLYTVLQSCPELGAEAKKAVVEDVDASLRARGVALVWEASQQHYYVLLAERYTREGFPQSWERLCRQLMLTTPGVGRTPEKEALLPSVLNRTDVEHGEPPSPGGEDPHEHTSPNTEDAADARESRFDPVPRRFMWAYFYAFSHARFVSGAGNPAAAAAAAAAARGLRVGGLLGDPNPSEIPSATTRLLAEEDTPAETTSVTHYRHGTKAPATVSTPHPTIPNPNHPTLSPGRPTLQVIRWLCADGSICVDPGHAHPRSWSPTSHSSASQSKTPGGPESDHDSLYPIYRRFLAELWRNGWDMDLFMVPNEGYTIAIDHV